MVEPIGEGSNAVGSSYFMLSDDFLQGKNPFGEWWRGNTGEEFLYIDDTLKDTPAIHYEVKVPDDQKVYGNAAGATIPYSGFMLYPTTEENPYAFPK